jgi:hypothetical protein
MRAKIDGSGCRCGIRAAIALDAAGRHGESIADSVIVDQSFGRSRSWPKPIL